VEPARALVDAWVSAPYESGRAAIEDLVERIAEALARRDAQVAVPEPVQR
jgi:hypothetical protein